MISMISCFYLIQFQLLKTSSCHLKLGQQYYDTNGQYHESWNSLLTKACICVFAIIYFMVDCYWSMLWDNDLLL
jgi:hypothetical protein